MDNAMTQSELANALSIQSEKIRTAETANRSTSTMNRLWRRYFQIEDALKSFKGGW